MAKKKAKPEPNTGTTITVSAVRIAEVLTIHGTFYRLIHMETENGKLVSWNYVNEYFSEPEEIANRASQIMAAMQMPVVEIDTISVKN
jgi:hypothetical protein